MYLYRATVLRIVDADTIHADVDLGFDIRRRDSFRLAGINAPELSTAAGKEAKAYLERLLPKDAAGAYLPVTIRTEKDRREKYGRYLAWIELDGKTVNEILVEQGYAVRYP